MAQLMEVLAQKRMIDQKIDELQEILLKEQNDEIAAELITLLDDRQAHNIIYIELI